MFPNEQSSDDNPNAESGLPHRSRGNAETALESAAIVLRRVPSPAERTQARCRAVLRGRQERDLLDWARANKRLVDPSPFLDIPGEGGEEHQIGFGKEVCYKLTHSKRYGFTVVADGGIAELTAGLPLEYLERLLLQNRLFGDQVELIGVGLENETPVMVTSQPLVSGSAVSREEMIAFMAQSYFFPLEGLSLGHQGSLAFYRDLDQVAAFDAHPGNFLKDDSGAILPIDLILLKADDALGEIFEHYLVT
ncbi:MAG: hypothetical protein ACI9R3_001035 [Verrucomicrobiales bacterium]|jgi:hypothetical protein